MRLPERRKKELSERFADHPLLALCRELTLPYKVQMSHLRLEPIEVFVLSANILDDLAEVPVNYYTTLQGRWLATQSLLQDYDTGADSRELSLGVGCVYFTVMVALTTIKDSFWQMNIAQFLSYEIEGHKNSIHVTDENGQAVDFVSHTLAIAKRFPKTPLYHWINGYLADETESLSKQITQKAAKKKTARTTNNKRELPTSAVFRLTDKIPKAKWTKAAITLYQMLLNQKIGWIAPDTTQEPFEKLFDGAPSDFTITFTGNNKTDLYLFFQHLLQEGYIEKTANDSLRRIVTSHFVDPSGQHLYNVATSTRLSTFGQTVVNIATRVLKELDNRTFDISQLFDEYKDGLDRRDLDGMDIR